MERQLPQSWLPRLSESIADLYHLGANVRYLLLSIVISTESQDTRITSTEP